ncbi:MAG: serine/threonine-protein kinase [Oleiphilaceae bacterium]|nr:serine/threonine-protein kinase [Oleiphilaceae bacterium]
MKEGRYQYQEKIGEGGMATVYKGLQTSLNRPVAIKVLSATLSSNPSVIKRFQRESLIIARLNHPNIITVIDKGTTSKGRPVFVMEYVEGVTLSEIIREQKLDYYERIDIAIQICKGVAYAHKLDVIHRDIKPANVIVDKEGHARLLDFGIASFFKADTSDSPDETRLIMGTEAYMAPEQQRGIGETTKRSDIYSLGVVMYELLAGHLPAPHDPPLSALNNKVTPEIESLVASCLNADPEKRPQSVEEVKTRLLVAMKGQHIDADQADRAGQGMTAVANKFGLLDVMQEDKHGAVYLYEDKTSHKLLVIKKKTASKKGFREAKVLQSLKHPNLVNILGTSKNDNVFIVVMDYIAGGSLQDRLVEPMPLQTFLRIATQACKGLQFAHRNRILHGNLRPSNILLTENLQVKLTDFGMDEHYRLRAESRNWYGEREGQKDELSDIYSLGAVFYHMLTSHPPSFKEGRLVKSQHFVNLPRDIQRLIERMLDFQRDARPQSVEAVASELIPFIKEEKTLVQEGQKDDVAPRVIERVVEVRRVNWLTIALAVFFILSVSLNVLLLSEQHEQIRTLVWEWVRRWNVF